MLPPQSILWVCRSSLLSTGFGEGGGGRWRLRQKELGLSLTVGSAPVLSLADHTVLYSLQAPGSHLQGGDKLSSFSPGSMRICWNPQVETLTFQLLWKDGFDDDDWPREELGTRKMHEVFALRSCLVFLWSWKQPLSYLGEGIQRTQEPKTALAFLSGQICYFRTSKLNQSFPLRSSETCLAPYFGGMQLRLVCETIGTGQVHLGFSVKMLWRNT